MTFYVLSEALKRDAEQYGDTDEMAKVSLYLRTCQAFRGTVDCLVMALENGQLDLAAYCVFELESLTGNVLMPMLRIDFKRENINPHTVWDNRHQLRDQYNDHLRRFLV